MRRLALACFLLGAGPAIAGPVSSMVRAEIDELLAQMESSGCDFQRNGKWHKAPEARSHLLRKLDYLEDKSLVATTEQFIELGASASSSSGKPYLVRCGGGTPVESGKWLHDRLKTIRSATGTSPR